MSLDEREEATPPRPPTQREGPSQRPATVPSQIPPDTPREGAGREGAEQKKESAEDQSTDSHNSSSVSRSSPDSSPTAREVKLRLGIDRAVYEARLTTFGALCSRTARLSSFGHALVGYAFDLEKATAFDPVCIFLKVLGLSMSAVQRKFFVTVESAAHSEFLTFWAYDFADSGEGKSRVGGRLTRLATDSGFPSARVLIDVAPEGLEAWGAAVKADAEKATPSTVKADAEKATPSKVKVVVVSALPQLGCGDATNEALAGILANTSIPGNLLWVDAESSLLKHAAGLYTDRGKPANNDTLRKSYDGDRVTQTRANKTNRPDIIVAQAFLSVVASTQVIELEKLRKRRDLEAGGEVSRFTFSLTHLDSYYAQTEKEDPTKHKRLAKYLKALGAVPDSWPEYRPLELPPDEYPKRFPMTEIEFNREADAFYREHTTRECVEYHAKRGITENLERFKAFGSRVLGRGMKIAALLHLGKCVDDNNGRLPSVIPPIDRKTAVLGFAWAKFFSEETGRAYATDVAPVVQENTDQKALERLAKQFSEEPFTVRDVQNKIRRPALFGEKAHNVRETLDALVEEGRLTRQPNGRKLEYRVSADATLGPLRSTPATTEAKPSAKRAPLLVDGKLDWQNHEQLKIMGGSFRDEDGEPLFPTLGELAGKLGLSETETERLMAYVMEHDETMIRDGDAFYMC